MVGLNPAETIHLVAMYTVDKELEKIMLSLATNYVVMAPNYVVMATNEKKHLRHANHLT